MPHRIEDQALAELRRSMGMTQREAALLLEVALNTWARWERGELGLHPGRARQVRRLRELVHRYGEGPMWGLGVDGLRDVLNGATVPEALAARGLDARGAPPRANSGRNAVWRKGLIAAIYARVSSEQQADEHTIASQVAALRCRVAEDKLLLPAEHEYLDEGYSGATLVRPALERVRDLVAVGGMDRLYVHSPDRLARRYAYQALLLDEFHVAGVEVVFSIAPWVSRRKMSCFSRSRA